MTNTADMIEATQERRRKGQYVGPERSQSVNRPYGRMLSEWERLKMQLDKAADRTGNDHWRLDEDMIRAGHDLTMYWQGANRAPSVVASYGNQRWNGTPISQMNMPTLLGPEWRETCRAKLLKAEAAVNCPETWRILTAYAEHGLTAEEAGVNLGYGTKSGSGIVVFAIRTGLRRLVQYWYRSQGPSIRD